MFKKKYILSEEEKVLKKEKIKNIVGFCVLVSFVIPIIFLIVKIISIDNDTIYTDTRTKSDYVLMLFQCLLGIIALIIPNMLVKKKNVQIPGSIYILYMIFLYCAIFLGEVRNFYYVIPHWDTILHCFSGMMIGTLGFSFISVLNKTENIHLTLTPFFVAVFAFMFSVTLGVVWEIYEYVFDGLLGLNMQKFYVPSLNTMLIGRAALEDTMNDLIVDMLGAFLASAIGYISLKYKKGWIEKVLIKLNYKK